MNKYKIIGWFWESLLVSSFVWND